MFDHKEKFTSELSHIRDRFRIDFDGFTFFKRWILLCFHNVNFIVLMSIEKKKNT